MSNLLSKRSPELIDAEIQRLASKTQIKMKRIHDPYADLNREIGRMTSRDSYVRAY